MKTILSSLIIGLLLVQSAYAQKKETVYLQDGNKESKYYIQIIPKDEIKSILLLLPGYGSTPEAFLEEINLKNLTVDNNILLVIASPKGSLTSFMENESINNIDVIISDILRKNGIKPDINLVIGGFSIGGNGAMLFSELIAEGKCINKVKLKGMFVVDSPIDLERFWYSEQNIVKLNFHTGAVDEAKKFIGYMTKYLNGSPGENMDNYKKLSPFLASEKNGGNAHLLKNTPVRLYTEPDEKWWKENRGEEYKDMNAFDLDKFSLVLKSLGSTKTELIKTENKGYKKDGRRHPHSWSIVDESDLIKWVMSVSNN